MLPGQHCPFTAFSLCAWEGLIDEETEAQRSCWWWSHSFPALLETFRKINGKKKKNDVGIGDVPGGPVSKTSPSNVEGECSIPGQAVKIPHTSWPKIPKHKREAIL